MRIGRSIRPIKLAGAMLAAAALLAACSTSSSSGSSAASSSGTSSGGSSSEVAKAQAFVKKYEQVPTGIPTTTPLKSKPPTGKTIVFMHCTDVSQCTDIGTGLQAATAAVGWTLKEIDYQSANPATLVSALQQGLQYHPVAAIVTGIPSAAWSSELAAYKQAGVPIIEGYTADPLGNGIIANVGGTPYTTLVGQIIANWVIADSGGKANIVSYQVPDFPVLAAFDKGFTDTIDSGCSACKITPVTGTIAQATSGQGPSQIVSALQRDPSANYVVTDDATWIDGLPSALSAAGLHVKVAGESGDVQALTAVKNGTEHAFTGLATIPGAWTMLDAALRYVEGMPVPAEDAQLPVQLLTKNVPFTVANSYNLPANYEELWKTLWKV